MKRQNLIRFHHKSSYNHEHGGVSRQLSVAGREALHRVRHLPGNAIAGVVRTLTGYVTVVDETERETSIQ